MPAAAQATPIPACAPVLRLLPLLLLLLLLLEETMLLVLALVDALEVEDTEDGIRGEAVPDAALELVCTEGTAVH